MVLWGIHKVLKCMLECSLNFLTGGLRLGDSQRGHVSKELKNLVSPWLLSGLCVWKDAEVGGAALTGNWIVENPPPRWEVSYGEKTPECGMNLEPVTKNGVTQREKNKYYILTWDLERWYWRIYLQGRNRNADIENELVDTGGKERVGWLARVAWKHMHHHA